jgi:hypothetical protein
MGHEVEAGAERVRHHVPRPYTDNMITDQIRSTVYLATQTREYPTSGHAAAASGGYSTLPEELVPRRLG